MALGPCFCFGPERVLGQGWECGRITQVRKMQREGLRTSRSYIFETKHNCTKKKCTLCSCQWPGPARRRGLRLSDGGRPPVIGQFRRRDGTPTPIFRLTQAFGLRSLRKNGYVRARTCRMLGEIQVPSLWFGSSRL